MRALSRRSQRLAGTTGGGHEHIRKMCLEAPKWGNDDDRADRIFVRLVDKYNRYAGESISWGGEPYDPTSLAISTVGPFGAVCGATPDGRFAGEFLADGVTSPSPGTDKGGPTAVVRSTQKIDHTQWRGGLLNMKFHPSVLKGINGSRRLLDLIDVLFQRDVSHVQFNVVDSRMLRVAQQEPEKFRDLIVRVAGFSAYFVELGKDIQDQIIERSE